jgi:hypothetical protein
LHDSCFLKTAPIVIALPFEMPEVWRSLLPNAERCAAAVIRPCANGVGNDSPGTSVLNNSPATYGPAAIDPVLQTQGTVYRPPIQIGRQGHIPGFLSFASGEVSSQSVLPFAL